MSAVVDERGGRGRIAWLLCDYGNVLCLDQSVADRQALAEAAGREEAAFSAAYWASREAYDRGTLSGAGYWTAVCGHPLAPDKVDRLVALDVASWTRPNKPALAAVARARSGGLGTAILSNAPVEVARAVERLPWLAAFSPRLFSCDLGEVKPSPVAFARALEHLGAAPGEVCFVDDRPANVEAARRLGMAAVHFRDPAQLRRLVEGAVTDAGAGTTETGPARQS